LGGVSCRALIDTGATCVMITDRLVMQLGLQSSGQGTNFTAAGPVSVSEFRLDVAFDLKQNDGSPLAFKVDNALSVCLPESEHHDIVLGTEVLHCFDMSFGRQQGPFSLVWSQ
jgi:Aspartyl protease